MKRALLAPLAVLLALAGPSPASANKGRIFSTNTQVFSTGAGSIECVKASDALEFASLKFEVLVVPKLEYTECLGLGTLASVSNGAYEFSDHGVVRFTKNLTIEFESLPCSIVFTKAGNGSAEKVSYENHAGKLRIGVKLTSLTYTTSGGACGSGGTNGKYTGTLELEEE